MDSSQLWNRNFILFFICTAQSAFGSAVSGVAMSFLVLKITGSVSAMSTTLALNFLPAVLTPFLATFIDRLPLKPPMLFGMFARGLMLISVYLGMQHGFVNKYSIYCLSLFTGFITAFYGSAVQSLIPLLIPKDQLQRGNSLLGVAGNSMTLIGLLCGGALVGLMGPSFALFIEGICYIVCGKLLFLVNMPKLPSANMRNSFLRDFILGFEYIKNSNIILIIVAMFFLITAIISPLSILMPVYMNTISRGAVGYSIFMACVVSGTLFGNVFIAFFGKRFDCFNGVFYGWLGISLCLTGLGLLNTFSISLVWAVLLGISSATLNTGVIVILQKIVPAAFRARVIGSAWAVTQISAPISLFFLSFVIKKISLTGIFISGAILTCIFSLLWRFLYIINNAVTAEAGKCHSNFEEN
ncbi:MAG: MFS transporter [Gammaproteobacteria bacterium]|nr:MFS transporter [Gammaproteobacteria bacterium]